MSSLTLFSNGNQLPAHLQRRELSETTKALMGGGFNKRISIEAGVFRLIAGGQEVATKEERFMNVVVVRAADTNSRTFYEGDYVKGSKVKPTCWSDNSVTPHEDVKNPQASSCATCPQNIKGSGKTGDSRACRYQRRLAVLLENDMEGDIYAMSIPAASLFDQGEGRKMGLQQYARFLGSHGVDINAVVTEMRFDMNATAPKLNFSATRPLEAAEYEVAIRRRDEQAAIDAVTMTVGAIDGAEETSTAAPAQATAPAPAPVQQAPAPAPRPAAAAVKPAVKPATAAPAGFTLSKNVPVDKAAEPVNQPVAEPVVRATSAAVPNVPNVASILDQWSDEADD